MDSGVSESSIPRPIYDADPALVDFYGSAWARIASHLRENPALPCSLYLDPETDGDAPRRIRDCCMLAMAAKYDADMPVVQSLDNLHAAIGGKTGSGAYPLDVREADFPYIPWVEYECALISGDISRGRALLASDALPSYYERIEAREVNPRGPNVAARRVRGDTAGTAADGAFEYGRLDGTDRGSIFSVDMLAKQCLSALCVSRIAALAGDAFFSSKWRGKFSGKKTLLRRWYFDSDAGLYMDLDTGTMKRIDNPTAAGFWPILCTCPDLSEIAGITGAVTSPERFGGEFPFASLPRTSPKFDPESATGDRGAVLPIQAYIALSGLCNYDMQAAVRPLVVKLLHNMLEYGNGSAAGAFRASYPPCARKPGVEPPPDDTGVSTILPICGFMEAVLGLYHIDAFRKLVCWNPPAGGGLVGVENLRFGGNRVDLLFDGTRCRVRSVEPFILQLNGEHYSVPAGPTLLQIPDVRTR